MTVSGEVAASIRSGNCKDNIQAEEVDNFMKSIRPHWISSSANNIVGPSGDIVLSSMTLHQACRQVKAPNSEMNLTHVAMIGVYALNDLVTQISHAEAAGAVFVYWHHGVNEFQYFTMQDNDMYHQELRNLRNQRISGIITCVMAGEPLVVSGNTFHVMEITCAGAQCAPCMLLRRDGNTDHLDVTPYLFKSNNSLNAAITYINGL